jgi:radical SAM superfamily enzyme YgiQ (UPF0313 family)
VRYVGKVYRPPSEADALIVQATIGCSWNHCTYCDMYRDKPFRGAAAGRDAARPRRAGRAAGDRIDKLFLADGDALVLPTDTLLAILVRARERFPRLERVSCYAMARNVAGKSDAELLALRDAGLTRLYIGPESGDDVVLKRIAKGDTFAGHVSAAERAHRAGMELSVIALLGIAMERSSEHARATAALVTAMDPAFFSALTVTVVPGTPLATLTARGSFRVPGVPELLRRAARDGVVGAPHRRALSHQPRVELPAAGRSAAARRGAHLRHDRRALAGEVPLRPEHHRGL